MLNRRLTAAFCLACTVVLFATCSRSESGDDDSDAAQAASDEAAVPAPSGTEGSDERQAAVPLRLTDQGRSRADEQVVSPADPRDSAFEGQRFSAVPFHPSDMVLGPFGTGSGGSARDRAILAAAESLFSSLLEGELPVDTLSDRIGPGGRAMLEDLVWAAESLGEVRLGVVEPLTASEVSVPFRLVGEQRAAVGEVILEKAGDQWYTADIRVDFFDRDTTTSRFDPGAVRSNGSL